MRLAWALVGWSAQAAFYALLPALAWFLQFGASRLPSGQTDLLDAAIDLALVAAFAVSHSILLLPAVRRRITRRMPPALYGSLFCWASCVPLASLIAFWRPLPGVVWNCDGPAAWAVLAIAASGWLLLGHSMRLSGFGWQTGWTPFRAWSKNEPEPRRELVQHGLYGRLRHPIYLSFLIVAWAAPTMSTAHLLLSVGLTC